MKFPESSESFQQKEKKRLGELLIVYTLLGVSLASTTFHNLNKSMPIDNFKKLEARYKKIGGVEILYFNDQYIIISVQEKNKEKVLHVEKFDTIFEG